MARVMAPPGMLAQVGIVSRLRWRMFVNSLRSTRARLEAISILLLFLTIGLGALGGGIGIGFGSYYFAGTGRIGWLALFYFGILAIWQLVPLLAVAATSQFDFSSLLRFPMRFSVFVTLSLGYGLADPVALVCLYWLLAITVGVSLARVDLAAWAILLAVAYALLNLLLNRMLFVWLERWLARRRTRELLGIVFLLLVLCTQFIGPITARLAQQREASFEQLTRAARILAVLPPGLAGQALASAAEAKHTAAAGDLALLFAYAAVFGGLLGVRLRAEYRGDIVVESSSTSAPGVAAPVRPGWRLPVVSGAVAAIFEKEVRYLRRSGPMLFLLVLPLLLLAMFGIMPDEPRHHGNPFAHAVDLVFPIGVAYASLMLTNLAYNAFAYEGAGIQFLFVAPVRFRDVMLGKNLMQTVLTAIETGIIWLGVCLIYRPPSPVVVAVTLAWLVFVLPVNFAVGNLMSLFFPRKLEFGAFRRQRASGMTVLVSMGSQALAVGLGAILFAVGRVTNRMWIPFLGFVALGGATVSVYFMLLQKMDGYAARQREVLMNELCRQL